MGIIPKNENKSGEMIEIMNHLMQYVPTVETDANIVIESTEETVPLKKFLSHRILLGGDQLTAARARSAVKNVGNGNSSIGKLLGLIPVIEDWHTKLLLLVVSYNEVA